MLGGNTNNRWTTRKLNEKNQLIVLHTPFDKKTQQIRFSLCLLRGFYILVLWGKKEEDHFSSSNKEPKSTKNDPDQQKQDVSK